VLRVRSSALSTIIRSDARRQSPDGYDMRAAAAAVTMKMKCMPAVTRHACCMALISSLWWLTRSCSCCFDLPQPCCLRQARRKGKERTGQGREGKERKGKGRKGKERKGQGREGKGREGQGREGKGREGKGREGKEREGKERKENCQQTRKSKHADVIRKADLALLLLALSCPRFSVIIRQGLTAEGHGHIQSLHTGSPAT